MTNVSVPHYIADTHALIWHFTKDSKLSRQASEIFSTTDLGDTVIYVSAMSLIEIVYLGEKGRVSRELCNEVFHLLKPSKDTSYRIAPIDHAVTAAVSKIPRSSVPEMADRVIGATALHFG